MTSKKFGNNFDDKALFVAFLELESRFLLLYWPDCFSVPFCLLPHMEISRPGMMVHSSLKQEDGAEHEGILFYIVNFRLVMTA